MVSEKKPVIVREVWAANLWAEFSLIQNIISQYRFASIDTEFPGVILTPNVDKHFYSSLAPSFNYSIMKANVDALKIIQIGLTLSDSDGNLPDFGSGFANVWQFNFQDFNLESDCCNNESIQLLQRQGIDFTKNKKEGIPSSVFRKFFLISGLLFGRFSLTWITFHGFYDFGFLIKILTARELPPHLHDFKSLVSYFFGQKVFDMKSMLKVCKGLYGGLERVAKTLNVDRVVGKSHQAGSDSLLVLQTFMKLRNVYFGGSCGKENLNLGRFEGVLYGLEFKA